jgi:thiaminase/transcriptional activator TenA
MNLSEFQRSALVVGAGELWHRATQADFLTALAKGTLPRESFHRWLVQDYLFAKGLTAFQAIATSKTPRPAQKTLIAGMAAMDAELNWFEQHAAQENLVLDATPHPTCRRYVDFLVAAANQQPFEVLLAILYGVEVAYLVAWNALEPIGPYAEFIHRWSNERFVEYVRALLEHCHQHPHADQQGEFNEVLQHEQAFWHMIAPSI